MQKRLCWRAQRGAPFGGLPSRGAHCFSKKEKRKKGKREKRLRVIRLELVWFKKRLSDVSCFRVEIRSSLLFEVRLRRMVFWAVGFIGGIFSCLRSSIFSDVGWFLKRVHFLMLVFFNFYLEITINKRAITKWFKLTCRVAALPPSCRWEAHAQPVEDRRGNTGEAWIVARALFLL